MFFFDVAIIVDLLTIQKRDIVSKNVTEKVVKYAIYPHG